MNTMDENNVTTHSFTPHEINLAKYSIRCIFSEISKFLLLLSIFILIHAVKKFFISLLILLPIRWNSGGIHFKSYTACLMASLVFFIFSTTLLPSVSISMPFTLITALFILITQLLCAPIPSNQRPQISMQLKQKYKIRSFFLSALLLLVASRLPDYQSSIIYSTLIMHSIQLIFAWMLIPKGGDDNA